MIRLFQGNVLDEFMLGVLAPWLRSLTARAWEQALPVAIVTPSPAKAQAVKNALLAAGVPMLGVEFWLPADLRKRLARSFRLPLPMEDCRLVAAGIRSVALEISASEPLNGTARALSKSAQSLADTIFMLESSGWDYSQIHTEPLRSIAVHFSEALIARGQKTVGAFDFGLLAQAREWTGGALFAATTFVGFDGLHWEHWPLLAAAAMASEDVMVTLPMAYDTAGEADRVWCSSWEQVAGQEAHIIDSEVEGNDQLKRLASHIDIRSHDVISEAGDIPCTFLSAHNLIEEARTVAVTAARHIANGTGTVGILVPGPGALAREVTLALNRSGIEHYTTVPGYASPAPHAGSWPALLDALADGSADSICVFLRTNGELADDFTSSKGSLAIARALENFAAEMLVADVAILRTLLGDVAKEGEQSSREPLRAFLKKWPSLPNGATFGQYLEQVRTFTQSLGWDELAIGVAEAHRQQAAALDMPLSLAAACEWLRSSLPARRVHRTTHNANPYARIQVMTPTDAVGRTWGHLIFSGQAEGSWPPPLKPAGYLGEEAVRALNQQARDLNSKATTEGIFGEGMTVVKTDKGFCVGPLEQRFMYLRDLIRLIESTTEGVTFSTATKDETDNGKIIQPGDFYRRVYLAMTGLALDVHALEEIAVNTRVLTAQVAPKAAEIDTVATRMAWDARNTGDVLSEYEFTLGDGTAPFKVTISPSSWARVFDTPAEVFLENFIGVYAPNDHPGLPSKPSLGIWAHRFTEMAARNCAAGEVDAWIQAVQNSSGIFLAEMAAAMNTHSRVVPNWWKSTLTQARVKAMSFAREAALASTGLNVLVERSIPKTPVKLPSGKVLNVGGRFDLLLSSMPAAENLTFSGGTVRLIDFKTGTDKPLKGVKSIARFEGLQPSLYLMALLARGAQSVEAAILPEGVSWSSQIGTGDLLHKDAMEVFERMANMQESGLLGWTGIVRDPYSIGCAYPMATLAPRKSPTNKFLKSHNLN